MTVIEEHPPTAVYIDPSCPWAWRGSRWLREVAGETPMRIEWRCFSLKIVNEGRNHPRTVFHQEGLTALRVLCLVRRSRGTEGFGHLYDRIGQASHERNEELSSEILATCISDCGLAPTLIDTALEDPTTLEEVRFEHGVATSTVGGFGVPTIILPSGKGIFGPVLGQVPKGRQAVRLWDRVREMIETEGFYELKRSRR